jgi:uncharacterized protein YjiS (DUF1127 family)
MTTQSVFAPRFTTRHGTFNLHRVWAVAGAMLQARRTRRLLVEMDGRLLSDIGTSRADAATEANRPFWDIR